MFGIANGRARRRAIMAAAVLLVSAGAAGCGGDDEASSSSGGSDDGVVAQAKTLATTLEQGLVYATSETPTSPGEVEAYGEWRGPDATPTPGRDVSVQVIACAMVATGCKAGAEGAVEAARALGWKAQLIDGGGTPQGWARAFSTAIQRKPDAIVSVAVPSQAVGDALAQARQQGIATISAADAPPAEGEKFDGYLPYPLDATWSIAAWSAVADKDGEAKEIVPQETDYPVIVQATSAFEKAIGQCTDCSVDVVDWQAADSFDPARVNRLVGGALSRTPDATGIFVSLGHVLPPLRETLDQSGKREQLRVGVGAADPTGIQLVAQGVADYTVGTPPAWVGWAAIDQAIRQLADEPLLTPEQTGVGIAYMTTETAPESGDYGDFENAFDYRSEYQRLWGVG